MSSNPATPSTSYSMISGFSPISTASTLSSSVDTPITVPDVEPTPTQTVYEDVAIVGMSCRTAGDNNTPEKLWQFLLDKKGASGEVPKHRWEAWYRRDPRNAKVIDAAINKGYFINDLENFDASFFGISPNEAEQMDPHQRLGLELAWEALENAGIDPKSLAGSDTAVYMGVDSDDYSRLLLEDIPNIEAWMGIGSTAHGIPNRISYHLDLMGTSSAVDAACASSLVAVHMGRQAIANGESRVAIVGGVNVLCSPALFVMLGRAGALSPDGVCQSFDDDAHGYARGEGGAILVLKRLSDAKEDNDNILAVLKATALAQDGKTNGIMAPNAAAQEKVARWALERSGVDPSSVGYIEAHATSTSLGDPTEVSALAAVYGKDRPVHKPAYIGSIKPNVGHLEAAAGAISLIKAVLAVYKGELAPQTRLNVLNKRIDWENSGLQVVRERMPWQEIDGLRRAAVCSYGYGGSVSHAIIEEYRKRAEHFESAGTGIFLFVLSSAHPKRLPQQALALADWLETDTTDLKAVSNTLLNRRAAHPHRAAFTSTNRTDLCHQLRAYAKGEDPASVLVGRTFEQPGAVWVFSGHGSQWINMGKELLSDPVFRATIDPLDKIVQAEVNYSAIELLACGAEANSDRVQVLIYLMQVGLTAVLQHQGLRPRAIIGHSLGEIAAAVAAGTLTPEEGTIVITRRAKLYARVQGHGAMVLVNLPFAQVAKDLAGRTDVIAAIDSSPTSCVISGESAAVTEVSDLYKSRKIKIFRVGTDIAFHSHMLNALSPALDTALRGQLQPQKANIPLYSTSLLDARSAVPRDVDYWINNMINPVWLQSAVGAAVDDGYRVFVEVSPHPNLSMSIDEIVASKQVNESIVIPTMKRNQSVADCLARTAAQLWVVGSPVTFNLGSKWATNVPGTPWVHKPYWRKVETGSMAGARQHDVDSHTLLGEGIDTAGTSSIIFSTLLDDKTKPYPGNHPLGGTEIVPAAVYINTFHHATSGNTIRNIELKVPVSMTSDIRTMQLVVEGDEIRLASRARGGSSGWVSHSSAKWCTTLPESVMLDLGEIRKRIGTVLPIGFAWEYLQKVGVSGIAFPWQVTEHYGNDKEMLVRVDMLPNSDSLPWDQSSWAPMLDAATSVGATIFWKEPRMRIVSRLDEVTLCSTTPPPKIGHLYVELATDATGPAVHVTIADEQGVVITKITSMRFSEVEAGLDNRVESLVHQIAWVPPKFEEKPMEINDLIIISSDPDLLHLYTGQIGNKAKVRTVSDVDACLAGPAVEVNTVIIYIPQKVETPDIAESAHKAIWNVVKLLKAIHDQPVKLFVLTRGVHDAVDSTGIAYSAVNGLARIAANEHPEIWGGLIDVEDEIFPWSTIRYVQGHDVIRIQDGIPFVGRLRPIPRDLKRNSPSLQPKPEGTYVITGGFGALGLEVLEWLVEKGARRLVVISRAGLPPRREWSKADGKVKRIIDKAVTLEKLGATISSIKMDIGSAGRATLLEAIDQLDPPPVLGVVHAAGVLEDNLIRDTTAESFARVFAPKISGSLALHEAFPPGTIDFFVLFSSIGQVVGTSGQAPYGSANAFLDGLARHRRSLGDNAVAFQCKGVTDITRYEAFKAWEYVGGFNVAHAVITRVLPLDIGQPAPISLVEDAAPRRTTTSATSASIPETRQPARPKNAEELRQWLKVRIQDCIGGVLKMESSDWDDIDEKTELSELGVDSVTTVVLRQRFQKEFGVKVPATLTWKHPTVGHLVEWFFGQLSDSS